MTGCFHAATAKEQSGMALEREDMRGTDSGRAKRYPGCELDSEVSRFDPEIDSLPLFY